MNTEILISLASVLVGLGGGLIFFKYRKLFDFEKRKHESEEIVQKSKKEAEEILSEIKERIKKRKETLTEEMNERTLRIKKIEEKLKNREESVKRREQTNNEIKLKAAEIEEGAQGLRESTKRMDREFVEKLSEKTKQNPAELKEDIIMKYKNELEEEELDKIAKTEEFYKENAEKIARKILVTVMQRLCSPTSVESRAVHIKVARDQAKGKIVGKDAKNIKEFEEILGVDVVFNDLPNTISVSCFNLVTRRIAQRALEKLADVRGEIDSALIKKAIESAQKDTESELFDIGRRAVAKMGLKITNKNLLTTIGRLQFRTSYGQNILRHSMEVAWVSSMLGSELGLNVDVCRIGGFLHDLGKAIDQDPNVKDAHDFLTKELMEKYGFSPEEVHAAWTHHESVPIETPEAMIVRAADAVSAGRPGARQESLEKYSERLHALEKTVNSFEGIKKSFAISAGREIRVIVDPDVIVDAQMPEVAHKMTTKIEQTLAYPGKIKVNLIRRTKYIEIAK